MDLPIVRYSKEVVPAPNQLPIAAHEAARGAAWLAKQVEVALAEIDLTLPQYRVLALLNDGSASATDAAERLAVSPPSVTAVIDGLVARTLVLRAPVAGDRRRVELVLTDAGTCTLSAADEAVATRLAAVSEFGPIERAGTDGLEALSWWRRALRGYYEASRSTSR